MWTFDFGCVDVEFRLDGCWILVVCMLDLTGWMSEFDCVDVGFWLHGCLILVMWSLN